MSNIYKAAYGKIGKKGRILYDWQETRTNDLDLVFCKSVIHAKEMAFEACEDLLDLTSSSDDFLSRINRKYRIEIDREQINDYLKNTIYVWHSAIKLIEEEPTKKNLVLDKANVSVKGFDDDFDAACYFFFKNDIVELIRTPDIHEYEDFIKKYGTKIDIFSAMSKANTSKTYPFSKYGKTQESIFLPDNSLYTQNLFLTLFKNSIKNHHSNDFREVEVSFSMSQLGLPQLIFYLEYVDRIEFLEWVIKELLDDIRRGGEPITMKEVGALLNMSAVNARLLARKGVFCAVKAGSGKSSPWICDKRGITGLRANHADT